MYAYIFPILLVLFLMIYYANVCSFIKVIFFQYKENRQGNKKILLKDELKIGMNLTHDRLFFIHYYEGGAFSMYRNDKNNRQSDKNEIPTKALADFSIQDLLKGKNLEIVAAALLLTGKLKVDSVELFRMSPVVNVTLVGKYVTRETKKMNALANFLEENGDLTLDE